MAFLVGNPFLELQRVESTNNYATGLVHAGMAQHGTAVFAYHQTAGKGQQNRQWQSEAGSNIALSIILQPPGLALSQSALLSMAIAVGVHRFFSGHAGPDTKIKWPNDIYWRDRKAAGILIENVVQGSEWKAAVVGIGINVNQTSFDESANKAVSLKQITGNVFEPVALAKELCSYLSETYVLLQTQSLQIIEEYQSALYKRDETVRFRQGSRVFEAVVKNVTTLGELVVQHAVEESFSVGEIIWVI